MEPQEIKAIREAHEIKAAGEFAGVAAEVAYAEQQARQQEERQRLARDYQDMIEADAKHLVKALENGDRVIAHRFVDAIINNRRLLENLYR